MGNLNKSISFSLTAEDKQKLQQKAKALGLPLARMIRNIILEKYQNLTIGFVSPGIILVKQDIDIKRLRPPSKPIKPSSKEKSNFKECVQQLKNIFNNGIQILGKIEDPDLGIKTESELEVLSQDSEERMLVRKEKEQIVNC